jgi:glycosyltransferase involved in cell wall biosynthesis
MPAPRLSLFLGSLAGGGAERTMLLLAGRFAAAGHAVDLVAARAEGAYRDAVPAGVRVVDLAAPRMLAAVPRLVRYLRTERPAALLATTDAANLVALLARRLAGVPLRLVIRQSEAVSPSLAASERLRDRWRVWPMRWLYPQADAVIAISAGVADDLAARTGLRRDAIAVIHNPVDVARVQALAAQPPEHPWLCDGGPPVVLGVGRLVRQKDFATLLHAFAALRADRPARLLILGEGPERDALEALAVRLGVAEVVGLPGFAANPFAAMARAGVFALSSRWEGFGNVLVEALACGCPVVSTDCPSGPAEILEGGRWGALVPPGDAGALAAVLGDALARPGDADARRARARAFAPEHAVARYAAVLELGAAPTGSVKRHPNSG